MHAGKCVGFFFGALVLSLLQSINQPRQGWIASLCTIFLCAIFLYAIFLSAILLCGVLSLSYAVVPCSCAGFDRACGGCADRFDWCGRVFRRPRCRLLVCHHVIPFRLGVLGGTGGTFVRELRTVPLFVSRRQRKLAWAKVRSPSEGTSSQSDDELMILRRSIYLAHGWLQPIAELDQGQIAACRSGRCP